MSDRFQVSAKDKLSTRDLTSANKFSLRDVFSVAKSDPAKVPFMSFPLDALLPAAILFAGFGGALVLGYLEKNRSSDPKPPKPTGSKILIPPNIEMRNTKNKSKP